MGLSDTVPSEQRLVEDRGARCANDCGKNFTGKRNSKCKGSVSVPYLAGPRTELKPGQLRRVRMREMTG